MWNVAIILVAAGVVMLAYFWRRRSQTTFVIRIQDGQPVVRHGDPPADFLTDIQRIADFSHLTRGTIIGMRQNDRTIKLEFRRIAKANQWQFRNAWRNPV